MSRPRKIAIIGNPILRTVARTVTREELATPAMQSLIDDLVETERHRMAGEHDGNRTLVRPQSERAA